MIGTISVSNLHYALVTENSDSTYSYSTPKKIKGTNKISINPNPDTDRIKTQKGQMRKPALLGLIEVDFVSVNLTPEQKAEILGHSIDVAGITKYNYDDKSPLIALGFESEKANGSKVYVWLLAGRMKEMTEDYNSKGASVQLNVPKMVGFFRYCKKTGSWKITLDTDADSYDSAYVENWYTTIPIEGAVPFI